MAPSFGLKPPVLGWVDLIATGVPESDDRADLSIALATYQQQMSDVDGIDSKASSILTFAVGVAVAPLAFVASRETGLPDGAVGFFVAGFVVFLVAAVSCGRAMFETGAAGSTSGPPTVAPKAMKPGITSGGWLHS